MYLQRSADARVAGVCILNPWVRTTATLARAQVKHYYGRRLLERAFWTKLLRGGVDIGGALGEFAGKIRAARKPASREDDMGFQVRMAAGLRGFRGSTLLVLSGRDLTAKEFVEFVAVDPSWAGILDSGGIERVDLADADHTFSSAAWRDAVERVTLRWIEGIPVNP
jgi:hypothetical protein